MISKENLIIIGASGHGKVVADIAKKMNVWKKISFIDDDITVKTCLGFNVIGNSKEISKYKYNSMFIVAIGNNNIREKIQNEIEKENVEIATLIHPDAIIATDVVINRGTVIMAGVVVNSSTTIGKGCIINTASILDHDNNIEDYVHISPGVCLAGNIRVGNKCWIGIGSSIINNVSICSNSIIGAGAVVLKDILEEGTFIGVPARKIK